MPALISNLIFYPSTRSFLVETVVLLKLTLRNLLSSEILVPFLPAKMIAFMKKFFPTNNTIALK